MLKIRARKRQRGFTLVESMVGLTLLGVLMTGTLGSIHLSMMMAESSIYESTANNISQGYLEQVKSLSYEDILLAIQDPAHYSLTTLSPTYNDLAQATITFESINLASGNQPIEKDILINVIENGDNIAIKMPMKLWISVQDMNTGSSPVNALGIKVVYSYKLPEAYGGHWLNGQVQGVRARI